MNMPVPFAGDTATSYVNLATHAWSLKCDDSPCDERCERCSSKLVHKGAWYACGETVPRKMFVKFTDGTKESMTLEKFAVLKVEEERKKKEEGEGEA